MFNGSFLTTFQRGQTYRVRQTVAKGWSKPFRVTMVGHYSVKGMPIGDTREYTYENIAEWEEVNVAPEGGLTLTKAQVELLRPYLEQEGLIEKLPRPQRGELYEAPNSEQYMVIDFDDEDQFRPRVRMVSLSGSVWIGHRDFLNGYKKV